MRAESFHVIGYGWTFCCDEVFAKHNVHLRKLGISNISIFLHTSVHFVCGILSAICHTLSQLDDVGDKFSAFHSLSLPLKWCASIYLKYAHIQIIYKRARGGLLGSAGN